MISKQLPPTTLTAAQPRASAGGHAGFDGPVTADMISMGSALGCPFLAGMKRPEFGESAETESTGNLSRTGASSAALASVAGGLGMGAAAACCPHTSTKPEQQ